MASREGCWIVVKASSVRLSSPLRFLGVADGCVVQERIAGVTRSVAVVGKRDCSRLLEVGEGDLGDASRLGWGALFVH
jgi:hypothetical protein